LIKVIYQEPGHELLDEVMNLLLGNFLHDLFRGTSLVDDSDEVLRETEGDLVLGVLEDVIHHECEGANQFVTASDQSSVLVSFIVINIAISSSTDELIHSDQRVNSLEEITNLKLSDMVKDECNWLSEKWIII